MSTFPVRVRLGLLLGMVGVLAAVTILADATPSSADPTGGPFFSHGDADSVCPHETLPPVSPPPPNDKSDVVSSIADYLSAGASVSATLELFQQWQDFTEDQLPRDAAFGFINGSIQRVRVMDRRDPQYLVSFDDWSFHELGADVAILECRDRRVSVTYVLSRDGWFPGLEMRPRSYVGDRFRRLSPFKLPMRMHIYSVQDVTGDGLDDIVLAPEFVGADYGLVGIFILSAHNRNQPWNIIRFPWAQSLGSQLEFVESDLPTRDMVFRVGFSGSYAAGVASGMTETWSFDGEEFTLQKYVRDAPEYQIQALEDGDEYFWHGQYASAEQAYDRVIGDSQLPVCDYCELGNSRETLVTFGYVRLLQLAAKQGKDERLELVYNQLASRRSAGENSAQYVDLGATFYNAFLKTKSYERACKQTVQYARTHTATFKTLYFGIDNYDYRAADMCIP